MENMKAEEVFEEATKKLSKIKKGERFVVKDLFEGYKWNRLNIAVRRRVGDLFRKNEEILNKVEVANKNCLEQQVYVKK